MVKNPPDNAGGIRGACSMPGLGRPSGREHGNPLQYNPMDRGAWWVAVRRVAKRQTWLKQFSMHASTQSLKITHHMARLWEPCLQGNEH